MFTKKKKLLIAAAQKSEFSQLVGGSSLQYIYIYNFYPSLYHLSYLSSLGYRRVSWPSPNSPHRLAIGDPALGQTKSYSVQPCLLLTTMVSPASRLTVFFDRVRCIALY